MMVSFVHKHAVLVLCVGDSYLHSKQDIPEVSESCNYVRAMNDRNSSTHHVLDQIFHQNGG